MSLPVSRQATPQNPAVTLDAHGHLVVHGALQRTDYASFRDAFEELCHSPLTSIFINLNQCTYISSMFVGVLVDSITQMKSAGKSVKVEVSPTVGRLLHRAHLYHLFDYEVVAPQVEQGK